MAESVVEIEDPLIFLKRIQEECPVVLSVLDSKQVDLISRSPTEAYNSKDVNDEYLTDMRCSMDIQQRIEDAEENLQSTLLMPRKVDKDVDVESFKKQTEVLKTVSLAHQGVVTAMCPVLPSATAIKIFDR